ncbi:MAG: molybdate ABC transporter substrate-binding protein [Methylotenera sp.]|nr:molybdate ABC transporter substrate-binding protein [Methylotenera sp.]
MSKSLLIGLVVIASLFSFVAKAEQSVTVFAAASLTNAITDIANAYEKDKQMNIQTSFASSSTLAKQIEKGAPADIFVSADTKWMNYLQDKKLVKTSSKVNLLGNQLVLIVPKGKSFKVNMEKEFNLAAAFAGKLCTGELESVPVGIYAKQALKNLDWWDGIKMRIVGTQDVRAALVFVERGECDAGVVYATDAKVSNKVESVAVFPELTHAPIVYPLALLNNANSHALAFYDYLKSEKAKAIFAKYGFNTNLTQ